MFAMLRLYRRAPRRVNRKKKNFSCTLPGIVYTLLTVMPKGLSATQRTLRCLREQGRICGIVERFNAHVGPFGIRQDLFGYIDILALDPQRGIIAIQSCGQSFAEHARKILENEIAPEWLKAGGKIELYGWRKVKLKRGMKAERWMPRIREFTLADFGQKNFPSPLDSEKPMG